MTIDWTRVRRVICNHLFINRKPTREDLNTIADCLPDAKIIGFGVYQTNYVSKTWYVLVESQTFSIDEMPGLQNVNMRDLPRVRLALVP